ncbi:MAG TPA: WD40 repeat domain-containing protein, partial [Thermoanaerobaculia bacterium]|nr:WD40 repeat domain-containing protein [Thermoanaerobaculia bacterium]
LRAWKELSDWIDADREALRTRRRLDEAVNEWLASGRDSSFLYIGARLIQAEEWAASHPDDLSGPAREFLAASNAQRDQELETRRRQRRRTTFILAAAVVAAVVAAAAMFGLWLKSQRQQQINLATQMASQARLVLASNPLTGLLLAAEAARLKDLPAAKGALLGALALSDAQPLGNTGIVAITASGDRRSLAMASQDGTVNVWSLASGPPKTPKRTLHGAGMVRDLALSNDRHWLLVRDGLTTKIRLLELAKGDQGTVLPDDEDWLRGTDPFSPDSRWLTMQREVTPVRHDLLHDPARGMPGSSPNPLKLDVNAKALPMTPAGAKIAALSSDGRWLAWGEESGDVRLQDMDFPDRPPIELPGQGLPIRFLLFAQGDRWLVTWSRSEAPRLWDLSKYPHGGILAATPNGSRLAVGRPPAVHIEDLGSAHPLTLQGVEPGATIWAFSEDGTLLAASSKSGNLLLWKLGSGKPNPQSIAVSRPITALAFSGKGDRLAIGGEGFATLWDLGNGDPKPVFEDPEKQRVTALAFGSALLATAWSQGPVRIFQLPELRGDELPHFDATVIALSYNSPNGKRLAMADGNGKAWL